MNQQEKDLLYVLNTLHNISTSDVQPGHVDYSTKAWMAEAAEKAFNKLAIMLDA